MSREFGFILDCLNTYDKSKGDGDVDSKLRACMRHIKGLINTTEHSKAVYKGKDIAEEYYYIGKGNGSFELVKYYDFRGGNSESIAYYDCVDGMCRVAYTSGLNVIYGSISGGEYQELLKLIDKYFKKDKVDRRNLREDLLSAYTLLSILEQKGKSISREEFNNSLNRFLKTRQLKRVLNYTAYINKGDSKGLVLLLKDSKNSKVYIIVRGHDGLIKYGEYDERAEKLLIKAYKRMPSGFKHIIERYN